MIKPNSDYFKKPSILSSKPITGKATDIGHPEVAPTQEMKSAGQKAVAPIQVIVSKRVLSPEDVALVYAVKKATLASLRAEESGPRYSRIDGNTVVYFPKDIEKWLKKRAVQPKETD